MRKALVLAVLLAFAPAGQAKDIEAGKAKVGAVCAACHGANGVSVSDTIPNLAGQRATYLETQLKALKDGSRKNAIMNAIATQLSAEDISNVAAFLASLPGAGATAKSTCAASSTPCSEVSTVPVSRNWPGCTSARPTRARNGARIVLRSITAFAAIHRIWPSLGLMMRYSAV